MGTDLFRILNDEQYASLHCIDNLNDISFFGAPFDTESGNYFEFSVTKCIGKSHCKSIQEINDFMEESELSIIIAYN